MNSPSRVRSRICGSAFVFATCLGIWLPHADAATLVDLDATQLPEGPLAVWTNAGMIGGDFAVPTNAVAPSVTNVDGIRAVRFLSTGVSGGGGTHYIGPEVPPQLTGAGTRTVEAWIHNPTPQLEETIFAWGRRGGIGAPEGKNFSFGHGTNLIWGALVVWGSADIGWANHQSYGLWTYVVATYDGSVTRVYSDGQLANSKTNVLNTAMFAASTTNAAIDSTNLLHFRIARQNTDTGGVDPTGAGAFSVARIKVYDYALDGATIQGLFDSQKASFNLNDTDGDGLPDWYEARCGLDKNDATGVNGANGDKDGDGLTNLQEFQLGTRADLADTDGDGVNDGAEVNRIDPQTGLPAPTNPLDRDTDHDGLSDGVETDTGVYICMNDTGSDPLKVDTDGDGCPDYTEAYNGSNPSDPNSVDCAIYEFPITPPCPMIDLNASRLAEGSLTIWTNTGTVTGNFVVPSNAMAPSVVTVDSVRAVAFQATGGAIDGTHLVGPEVPTQFIQSGYPNVPVQLTAGGARTVEAWIRDPSPQSEETVFAWGRRGGNAPDGRNFSFGHGTNSFSGAVDLVGSANIDWANKEVFGRWTYIVVTCSGTNYFNSTNLMNVYADGQLANSEVVSVNTADFAADAPDSPTDSANRLHFRIARQNNDTGGVDGAGIGGFNLARLRVSGFAMNPSSILARFNSEQKQFQAPLRIEAINVDQDSGAVTLSWIAAPGRSVSVQTSSNLVAWSAIASNLLGNIYTDVPGNSGRFYKFYRLSSP